MIIAGKGLKYGEHEILWRTIFEFSYGGAGVQQPFWIF